jgi:hypothetical protein
MLRRLRTLFLALPALGLLAWGGAHWWNGEEGRLSNGEPYTLSVEEVSLLQDGDIILRRGSGMVSDMIAALLNEDHDLSHCGIVVERGGVFRVVHAVSNNLSDHDGMQVHALPEFVRQSKPGTLVVCRLRTVADRSAISRKALHYLRRAVPFDHHFDRVDSSTFYCSELIWRICLDEFGIDIFEGAEEDRLSAFRFARFLDPRWFEVVLDHQQK